MNNAHRVRDFGALVPKWKCLHESLPLKAQKFTQKRKQKDFRATGGERLHDATEMMAYMNPQRMWQHTQGLYMFKSDRVSWLRGGSGQGGPDLSF